MMAMKEGNTKVESKSMESFQSDDSCNMPMCGFFLLEKECCPFLTKMERKHKEKDQMTN